MSNARQCGCDPDATTQQLRKGYRCRDFPDCVYGNELTTYKVVIYDRNDEVVRSLPASTFRAAEKIESGVERNLNHNDYYTKIIPVPPTVES